HIAEAAVDEDVAHDLDVAEVPFVLDRLPRSLIADGVRFDGHVVEDDAPGDEAVEEHRPDDAAAGTQPGDGADGDLDARVDLAHRRARLRVQLGVHVDPALLVAARVEAPRLPEVDLVGLGPDLPVLDPVPVALDGC